ncbi:MAG: cobalt ECF transporter T component CbiQ [Rhodobacterales bacterium]|nr:MAG: cobalt ECF transporter T component CbiQ [Rhodobacterales bacterium]
MGGASDSTVGPAAAGRTESGAITARDERLRIVLALVFAICVVALSDLLVLTLAFAAAVALLPFSGLPPRRTLKQMASMDGFILFILLLLPFTVPGTPLFTIWGFAASREGLFQGIEIALTANAVALALMCLVGSMEAVTMGHALNALRLPERLVHLLVFTVRYIEVLREENRRLIAAMKVRGFRPGSNWHTYRSYGYLVGMMLVRAVERSERILEAMKCRGFNGRFVLIRQFRLTPADIAFGAGFALLLAALIVLEIARAPA